MPDERSRANKQTNIGLYIICATSADDLLQKHIVDYIFSQGWEGPQAEIFMGLKDGTLKDLLLDPDLAHVPDRNERVAKVVIRHMLQALDFLSVHGIVHRDVKPENILYTPTPTPTSGGEDEDECLFQLGDFGLSNRQSLAQTVVGTKLYMAPEVERGEEKQTSKVDVWSLFVTMLWVLNTRDFRQVSQGFRTYGPVLETVLAATEDLIQISEMARVSPETRASAAQIHLRLFGTQGLTTTRIPPILPEPENSPSPSPASPFSPPADVKGKWPVTSPDNAAREAGTGWTVGGPRQRAASNPFGVGAKARAAQREWRRQGNRTPERDTREVFLG